MKWQRGIGGKQRDLRGRSGGDRRNEVEKRKENQKNEDKRKKGEVKNVKDTNRQDKQPTDVGKKQLQGN